MNSTSTPAFADLAEELNRRSQEEIIEAEVIAAAIDRLEADDVAELEDLDDILGDAQDVLSLRLEHAGLIASAAQHTRIAQRLTEQADALQVLRTVTGR